MHFKFQRQKNNRQRQTNNETKRGKTNKRRRESQKKSAKMIIEKTITEIINNKIKVEGINELITLKGKIGDKIIIELEDNKVIKAYYPKIKTIPDLTQEQQFWNEQYEEGKGIYCPNWEIKRLLKNQKQR